MDYITHKDRKLAYKKHDGTGPTVVFCAGFMSDMEGSKALALDAFCQSRGQAYLRFDYSGHGQSSGEFTDGTIGAWKEDALAIIDQVTTGDLIIVGSSMGGWIGLLCAIELKARVKGYVGLAAAPDFTKELCWDQYSDEIKETLRRDGVYYEPCDYGDEPYAMTMTLLQEGDDHLIMDKAIDLDCPVRLVHGMKDTDVPPTTAQRISNQLKSEDVVTTYVKNGDHRLSTDADLKRLCQIVKEISGLLV